MRSEESFGIIPLKQEAGVWKSLLVQHLAGHWTYPKGHKEPGESNLTAARRELLEETGLLVVEFLSLRPYLENYTFRKDGQTIDKLAWYYPATVSGDLQLQTSEIQQSRWTPLPEAASLLTHLPTQQIAAQVLTDFGS